jgi:hypothetical protein
MLTIIVTQDSSCVPYYAHYFIPITPTVQRTRNDKTMDPSKVTYSDTVNGGEYFCNASHSGFYVAAELADLIAEAEAGNITDPEGEPITEIHFSVCDDISKKVWSA